MDFEQKQLEERSDYLENNLVEEWYVDNEYFQNIQKKLKGTGAKLLVGPRGTGKTHQMLIAHMSCLKNNEKPVSLYVSFNRYYHLEPLISRAPNAIRIFHTWVLAKIVLAIHDFGFSSNTNIDSILDKNWLSKESLETFIGQAEKGIFRFQDEKLLHELNVSYVKTLIEELILLTGRPRAILLLDDAALTLTPEYLIEFFEIFISLKSSNISPKASVYPGTTEYGTKFHLGHDAEKVECWINVSDDMKSYSEFMDQLINKRLSFIKSNMDSDIIEILKYASFGIPRAFIFLVRSYIQSTKQTKQSKFNEVIDQHSDLIKAEYLSLKKKVPQFSNIIEIGYNFFQSIVDELTESTKNNEETKNIIVGIETHSNNMVERMIQFLNEAGLLYKYSSTVSHGHDREYSRYTPHIMFLIRSKAFTAGRGFDTQKILEKLLSNEKKQPLRRKFDRLLSSEDITNLKLDLPPCPSCGAIRIQENQRFCHVCGSELVIPSAFESCMELDVSIIPLTTLQSNAVKQANFKKIKDFYSVQNPASELIKVKKIGGVRSQEILNRVFSIVDEFLA
ncbi:zinc ribbon domain-containing protein [Flavobacterium amniphilum]|uniref:zinc ribbon domain-containing protein n=1 Tax=Flavobacterium amniphilum TaxID=1834035 RepID=UPI002029B6D0|nr:zinc ribbon domain-containing protein [Flavobacterium amniphilum]MCL9807455.1 zinc ribbon domain-containing protein [Flavobacterium amniphilum]